MFEFLNNILLQYINEYFYYAYLHFLLTCYVSFTKTPSNLIMRSTMPTRNIVYIIK